MSGFVIGKTTVPNLNSVLISDATTGSTPAYAMVWNGAIPAYAALVDATTLASGTAVFSAGDLVARPEINFYEFSSRALYPAWFRYDRSMVRTTDSEDLIGAAVRTLLSVPLGRTETIDGTGDSGNPLIGTTDGYLSCAYVAF